MKRILIGYPLDKYKELSGILLLLKAKFDVVFRDYDTEWLRQNIHLFHALVPSLNVNIDEKMLRKAKLLKLIFTPTTGTDHLKFDLMKTKIKVCSLADFPEEIKSISSTAELAFSFILSLSRRVFLAEQDVLRKGKWRRNNFVGNELNGKTLGIFGLGRVGSRLAKYAKAFGMRVIYWDIHKKSLPYERVKSIEGLLRESDYIVCALASNSKTQYFINQVNARFFKKNSFFINISRGKIVQERALCRAIDRGVLSGIGVDVLEEELSDFRKSPLYRYSREHPKKNILITPHIGGATIDAWKRVFSLVVSKILEYNL